MPYSGLKNNFQGGSNMRSEEIRIPEPEIIAEDTDKGKRLFVYASALSEARGKSSGLMAELEKTKNAVGENA